MKRSIRNPIKLVVLFILTTMFVVGLLPITLIADDISMQGIDIEIFNPKKGTSYSRKMDFIIKNGEYYSTNGNLAECCMYDLASPDSDCKTFERRVFSLYDGKYVNKVSVNYPYDDSFEYDGYTWLNANKTFELLKTKIIYDGEKIVTFPIEYSAGEIRMMLCEIYNRSEFKINADSVGAGAADTWKLMKSGNYVGFLSGTEMVNEYVSLLIEIGTPDDKLLETSNNLSEYYAASGTLGSMEKIVNGSAALSNLYNIKWTDSEGKHHVTNKVYAPGYDIQNIALSPRDALVDVMNYDDKQLGTWIDKSIDAGHDVVGVIKTGYMLNTIKSENPSYVKAMRYGIMVNPGDGDLYNFKAYTKDNKYMYIASSNIQDKMSNVYSFIGDSIADKYVQYGSSVVNKKIAEMMFTEYQNVFVDAFFAMADQFGISEHMEKVQYAAMSNFIMEKCEDNFNKSTGDLESMKYCTLMYLKTFLNYAKKYAESRAYIVNDQKILSAILKISSFNDKELYDFSVEHVLEPQYTLSSLKAYTSKNALMPYTYGYGITVKNSNVGNLIIPESINGKPVVTVKISKSIDAIRKVTIPSSVRSVEIGNQENLEEISLPGTVTSFGTDNDYVVCPINELRVSLSTLPKLKNVQIPNSVVYLSAYKVGLEEISIPASLNDYTIWYCNDLKKIAFNADVEEIVGSVQNCDSLSTVNFPASLKTIGDNAFIWCKSITDISIPDTVTTIGKSAFEYSTNIVVTKLPNNLTSVGSSAFHTCDKITITDIPDGVTTIGDYAFSGCENITISRLPSELKTIGESAFQGCKRMTASVIPNKVTSIGEYAFSGCLGLSEISIPESVSYIGKGAFYSCGNIENAVLPSSITSIPERLFSDCRKLTNIVFPKGVTAVGDYAFDRCYNLDLESIPDGVVSIGSNAFNSCQRIKHIPNSVMTIGKEGFAGCISITDLPTGVTDVGKAAFSNCHGLTDIKIPQGLTQISESLFEGCDNLSSVTFHDGVTSIGDCAFLKCKKLKSVSIPSNISYLGKVAFRYSGLSTALISGSFTEIDSAFIDCENIVNVTISDGITTIKDYAFARDKKLKQITIPASVTLIDKHAFDECSELTDVYYNGTESEWNSINIDPTNTYLLNAKIHFNAYSVILTKCVNGKASFSKTIANAGEEVAIKAVPDDGYELDSIKVDGNSINENKFIMPAKNVTVEVIFKVIKHDMTYVDGKLPTCTENGYKPYYKCTECGRLFSDPEGTKPISEPLVIPKLEHDWDEGEETKSPTCSEGGIKTFHCKREGCTETKEDLIPALGHDLKEIAEKAPTKEATGNFKHYKCERCGKLFSDSEGKTEITQTDTVIPVMTHDLTAVPEKKPACSEPGNTPYYICKDTECGCGKLFKDKYGLHEIKLEDTVIPANGHALAEVTAKEPSCTENGNIQYWKCSECGKLFADADGKTEIETNDTVVAPLGHDLKKIDAKAETYKLDGNIEYYLCNRCGKKFDDAEGKNELTDAEIVIPKKGAAVLGEEATVGNFIYRVTNPTTDGTGTVTLISVATKTVSVSIPSTVEIKESVYLVNRIGTKAFYKNTTIKSLTLGAYVRYIDSYAFYGCKNLTKVYGGGRLETIGSYAFAYCSKLKSFKITSSVLKKISSYTFKKDKKLKTIYVKNTTKLSKSGVKKSLKGSYVKTVKVKKSKVKSYKKYFKKKNSGRNVRVKK